MSAAYQQLVAEEEPTTPLPAYDGTPGSNQLPRRILQRADTKIEIEIPGHPAAANKQVLIVLREESIPLGMALFFSGFAFMPAWWIGSFVTPLSAREQSWRRINRGLAALSFVAVLAMFALVLNAGSQLNRQIMMQQPPTFYDGGLVLPYDQPMTIEDQETEEQPADSEGQISPRPRRPHPRRPGSPHRRRRPHEGEADEQPIEVTRPHEGEQTADEQLVIAINEEAAKHARAPHQNPHQGEAAADEQLIIELEEEEEAAHARAAHTRPHQGEAAADELLVIELEEEAAAKTQAVHHSPHQGEAAADELLMLEMSADVAL